MAQQPSGFVPDGFVPDSAPQAQPTPSQSPRIEPTGAERRRQLRGRLQSGDARIDDIAAEMDRGERERILGNSSWLPPVAGAVGGMVGGIPGAVIGGAIGEAGRQTAIRQFPGAQGAPETVSGQALSIAREGATQGALQVGGQAIAAGARGTGRWLMDRATTRVSARWARDFPELSQTLIDNALVVSKGGEKEAQRLLRIAKGKATAALQRAEVNGARIPVQLTDDLADSLVTAITQDAMKTGQAASQAGNAVTVATERLSPRVRVLLNTIERARASGQPMVLTPTQADLLKTQLQRESSRLYTAMRAGNGTPAIDLQAGLTADFATQLNSAIDAVATGYKAANAAAQPLIGATRGIHQAIRPQGGMIQAMVRPGVGALVGAGAEQQRGGSPIAGAVAGALLTTPSAMSREAIILAHPAMQAILRQMPRATAAALTTFLTEQAPQLQSSHSEPRPQP